MIAVLQQTRLQFGSRTSGYMRDSSEPLTALVFVLPFLVLYEGGLLLLGDSAMRNGADVWLRHWLDGLGLGQYVLLPLLVVGGLLAWHHLTHRPWKVHSSALIWMLFESALLGLGLLIIAQTQAAASGWLSIVASPTVSLHHEIAQLLGRLISFFGAGFYEEVLFRLMLVPLVVAALAMLGGSRRVQIIGAVLSTSLLFSLAHYVGPHGETFTGYTFAFRLLAGCFFGTLFLWRGFGIAVGAHALYDIFVGLF